MNLETGEVFYTHPPSKDTMEAELEKESDLDERYKQMVDGTPYQLWIDQPDKEVDQNVEKAELYARLLKK